MTTETIVKWTEGNKLDPQDVITRAKIRITNELQIQLAKLVREHFDSGEGERLGYSREEIEHIALLTYKELLKSINL